MVVLFYCGTFSFVRQYTGPADEVFCPLVLQRTTTSTSIKHETDKCCCALAVPPFICCDNKRKKAW